MHSYQIVSNANKSNLCNNKGLSCHIKSLEMENTSKASKGELEEEIETDACLSLVYLDSFLFSYFLVDV